jgi:hypothetical protein
MKSDMIPGMMLATVVSIAGPTLLLVSFLAGAAMAANTA